VFKQLYLMYKFIKMNYDDIDNHTSTCIRCIDGLYNEPDCCSYLTDFKKRLIEYIKENS
jgi:hypothetical protein